MSIASVTRNLEILERAKEGESIPSIGRAYGLHPHTVWRVLHDYDYSKAIYRRDRNREIVRLRQQGYQYKYMAHRFGISIPAVHYIIKAALQTEEAQG